MYEYELERDPSWNDFTTRMVRDCKICPNARRITYMEVEPDVELHTMVGGEEAIVPTQPLVHKEVDYFYFGNMDDLKTGRMLYTGDIAPKAEMPLNDLHNHHRDIDFTNREVAHEYIRGHIECDRRLKQMHNHGFRYYLREGPMVNVNWEHRVTGDRELAAWFNHGRQARYMTNNTTTNTTAGGGSAWTQHLQWNQTVSTDASTTYWNYSPNEEGETLLGQRLWLDQVNVGNMNQYQMRQRKNFSEHDLDEEGKLSLWAVKSLINKVFIPVPRKSYLKMKPEHKLLVQAKNRSEKLLKEWLSSNEYNGLKNLGELRIQDLTDPDTIYIIKKDPNKQVEVEHKGEVNETWCLVADKLDMPIGDQLLTKVMMLKADQAAFKKIAVKTIKGIRKNDDGRTYEGKIMPIDIITGKSKIKEVTVNDIDNRVANIVNGFRIGGVVNG